MEELWQSGKVSHTTMEGKTAPVWKKDAFASRHKTQPRPARQRSPSPEQGTRKVNDMRRKT